MSAMDDYGRTYSAFEHKFRNWRQAGKKLAAEKGEVAEANADNEIDKPYLINVEGAVHLTSRESQLSESPEKSNHSQSQHSQDPPHPRCHTRSKEKSFTEGTRIKSVLSMKSKPDMK